MDRAKRPSVRFLSGRRSAPGAFPKGYSRPRPVARRRPQNSRKADPRAKASAILLANFSKSPARSMKLRTTVSASPSSDAYDGMAYIYCCDPALNYCFSLTRLVGSDDIEVMVVDQIVHRVDRLEVCLQASGFKACLSAEAATLLDGHREYDIEFLPGDWSRPAIEDALAAIFRGKAGLTAGD